MNNNIIPNLKWAKYVITACIALAMVFSMTSVMPVTAEGEDPPPFPGHVEGVGTHFEITDSEYLNITLDSTEAITATLSSIPMVISINVDTPSETLSTELTLTGLAANTVYWKYMDEGLNPDQITTDANGSLSFTQDLSQEHSVWIQTAKSTININDSYYTGGDCYLVGYWSYFIKTCTLTQNVNESINITSNGITLDGAGYQVTPPTGSSYGIRLYGRQGVTLKNLNLVGSGGYGIWFEYSSYNTINNNNITGFFIGASLEDFSNSNGVTNNSISNSVYPFAVLYGSSYNYIRYNTFSGPSGPVYLRGRVYCHYYDFPYGWHCHYEYVEYNSIVNNNFINIISPLNVYYGIANKFHMPTPIGGNYYTNFDEPGEGCSDSNSNGFCDSPLVFPGGGDALPWTMQDGWLNQPPTADAGGPYNGNEGFVISLNASGSTDPDNNIASYEWDLDNDGEYDDASGVTTQVVFDDDGQYTVGVKVTDAYGETDEDSAVINVLDLAPNAAFSWSPEPQDEGSQVQFTDQSTSSPDNIVSWAWDFDGLDTSSTQNPSFTFMDDGAYNVCLIVTDDDNSTNLVCQVVTVNNVAPTATFNTSESLNEGNDITLSLTDPSDPSSVDTDTGFSYAFDCGDGGGYSAYGVSASATCPTDDNETRSVKGSIKDEDGGVTEYTAIVTIYNVMPTIITVTAPLAPVNINDQPVSVEVVFSDPGTADTHDVTWDWGDTNIETHYSVTSPANQIHTYNEAGVNSVTVTVTDDDGDSDSEAFEFIVIYDPSAGFVTGGGWIDSLSGAYTADPSLAGKANFGFVSKYQKGATVPTGNTEFQFHAADLNFHSDSYEWLVVTGSDYAKFKGVGTINGMGEYKFMLWAGDGSGTDGADTFRIKIWEEDEFGAEMVVYDNGFDQAISGGSIVIHTKK